MEMRSRSVSLLLLGGEGRERERGVKMSLYVIKTYYVQLIIYLVPDLPPPPSCCFLISFLDVTCE